MTVVHKKTNDVKARPTLDKGIPEGLSLKKRLVGRLVVTLDIDANAMPRSDFCAECTKKVSSYMHQNIEKKHIHVSLCFFSFFVRHAAKKNSRTLYSVDFVTQRKIGIPPSSTRSAGEMRIKIRAH